uniref:VWFA domain-containing protein n=1 Tax=Panagrolaimus sp. JU765 TaxID=591449 RepID=A0AC34RF29_9BILA
MNPITQFTPECKPVGANYSMIQPFWADVFLMNDTSNAIYYRQTTDYKVLNQFQQQLYKVFPNLTGTPITWAFITTWYNVTYYGASGSGPSDQAKRNTFQCALGSNGVNSFAIFYYNQIQWIKGDASRNTAAQVGFDSGDGTNRYMLDVSCTDDVIDVADMSNVGPAGVFIFRIDSANIQTGSTITALPTTRRRTTTESTTNTLPTTQYQTTTNYQPTTSSSAPINPLSNAIGNPCSTNIANAWLDIVLLIDVSNSMKSTDLNKYLNTISQIFDDFFIGQDPQHSTRVSVIAFDTDVQVVYDLNSNTNNDDLRTKINAVSQYQTNKRETNVVKAFQKAQDIFNEQGSYRAQAIILGAAAYDRKKYNADEVTNDLKEDGVSIVTIEFVNIHGVKANLSGLSSPGFSYNSTQNLLNDIPNALTKINCFCPENTIQFKTFDNVTQQYTYYADCFDYYNGYTNPAYAENGCKPGTLAAVTSFEKSEFIIDNVINGTPFKNFTVGAYYDGGWKWHNYNGTSFPVGQYPAIPSNSNGKYGYFYNYFGFNYEFRVNPGGKEYAMPYVCQYHACDADYLCDSESKKLH